MGQNSEEQTVESKTAVGRRENEPCQVGTVGCRVDHVTDSSCEPW